MYAFLPCSELCFTLYLIIRGYFIVTPLVYRNKYIVISKIQPVGKYADFPFINSYLCGSWRRQWHPTPVLLPGKSHGWRGLVGCSPWGREESDTTGWFHFHFSCIGEGNGNPLQYSCLENPRDGGAWWAAIYGVAQNQTWLWILVPGTTTQLWLHLNFQAHSWVWDESLSLEMNLSDESLRCQFFNPESKIEKAKVMLQQVIANAEMDP